MKSKFLRNLVCTGLAAGSIALGFAAEAALVPDCVPMLTYADHTVRTYDHPNGSQKGFISPNVSLIYIKQIRPDGWAYGSYPIAGGKRIYRWFRMGDVQGFPGYENYIIRLDGDLAVFRTPSPKTKVGKLLNKEPAVVVGESGDYVKIIYRVNGSNEYKMGWVYLPFEDEYGDQDGSYGGGGNGGGGGPGNSISTGKGNVYQIYGDVTVSAGSIDSSSNDYSKNDSSYHDERIINHKEINDYSQTDASTHVEVNQTDNSQNTTNNTKEYNHRRGNKGESEQRNAE